ncbi:ATP-binding protein [Robbsia sp. KACC 23696]|uniref:ATP-binding protein n=1 Tax=Robbsia sp. KACC 23696 TaxID=3149231 RepID=UPI00325B1FEB
MTQFLSASSIEEHCSREPIRIPGAIQPHGYLLTLAETGVIAQASENIYEWSGEAADSLLGRPLDSLFGAETAERILRELALLPDGKTRLLGTIAHEQFRSNVGQPSLENWALVLHRFSGASIIELERTVAAGDVHSSMYPYVLSFLGDIESTRSVVEIAQIAAREISAITGFGRTLVYAFSPSDEHGEVLAETLLPGFDSYLGQRFPAADIPAQARALYKENRIRLIGDANYVPQRLIPELHPDTRQPTDLTPASLRSVSPVHIRYMKNMRTAASMSMSIVVDGRLWGLISCHHDRPKIPPFEVRVACEHIAQLVSLQIAAREGQVDALNRLGARKKLNELLAHTAKSKHFIDALEEHSQDFCDILSATGAAIIFEGRVTLMGDAPPTEEVEKLVAWLVNQADDEVHTVNAGEDFSDFPAGTSIVGFCAISLSKVFRNYVVWFRHEVIQTIAWAGDPRAKLVNLAGTMSPRESFEVWTQTVRGRSSEWTGQEIEIAVEFRTALLALVLTRAEELANLVVELSQANRELEEFSYTVSHDLRAPLRHIHSFSELVRDMDGDNVSARSRNFLDRIIASAELGGKQVDDLLAFAQLGRVAVEPTNVDLKRLVDEIIQGEEIGSASKVVWKLENMKNVLADGVFLRRAMQNLLSNAIKFSAGNAQPVIEIGCYSGADELVGFDIIYVKDNGVGFDMAYADKLFGVFQRLHRDEDYSGTGIGLANVRRIAERHGGKVWAKSDVGQGATFFVALPVFARPNKTYADESASAVIARMVAAGEIAPSVGVRKKSLKDG